MFGDEEKKLLQGSQLINKINSTDQALRADYDSMCSYEPLLKDPVEGITYEQFKRGKLLVATRAYDIVYTDGNPR